MGLDLRGEEGVWDTDTILWKQPEIEEWGGWETSLEVPSRDLKPEADLLPFLHTGARKPWIQFCPVLLWPQVFTSPISCSTWSLCSLGATQRLPVCL